MLRYLLEWLEDQDRKLEDGMFYGALICFFSFFSSVMNLLQSYYSDSAKATMFTSLKVNKICLKF